MFRKTFKIIIGLLFIPVAIAATKAFLQNVSNVDSFDINLYLVIGGFFTYPVFHIIFTKPMYTYAWGHEIVHVLATWLCGGKVTSFHVSPEGGTVTTTKTNLFIRLSPYFIPIHTIFLSLIYFILSQIYGMEKFSREFIFLIGFTMSFHTFMTIEVMKTRQPDIIKTGYLFSILFIYVANVFIALLALSFIFKEISFVNFFNETCALSKDLYSDVFNGLFK